MDVSPIPLRIPLRDRFLGVLDRLRHPRLTRELASATRGFRAAGVVRSYTNDAAGRRRERREASILWHRGYRPPTRITHNAMWWTGGPAITIAYNREVRPAFLGERNRRVAERLGLLR